MISIFDSNEYFSLTALALLVLLLLASLCCLRDAGAGSNGYSMNQRLFSSPQCESIKNNFVTRIKLARLSYCPSRQLDDDMIIPTGEENPFAEPNGGGTNPIHINTSISYNIIATHMEDAIWLLERTATSKNSNLPRWFVLIRGTHVARDIVSDIELVRTVASDSYLQNFERVVARYQASLMDLFRRHNVREHDSIELVGHSLGACICEALLILLRTPPPTTTPGQQDETNRRFCHLRAFALDTPGTPTSFRQKHNDTLNENGLLQFLTIVNSDCNIINTLVRPFAEEFWVCADGSNNMMSLFKPLRKMSLYVALAGFKDFNETSHRPLTIQRHIESGNFRRQSSDEWPLYSGWIVTNFSKAIQGIRHRWNSNNGAVFAPDLVIDVHRESRRNLERENDQALVEDNREDLPHDLSNVEISRAYKVTEMTNLRDMMDPAQCMVIALVGETSVGKSSLLKALAGFDPDNEIIIVAPTVNTTVNPTLVRYPDRPGGFDLFLLDMPGVNGGAEGLRPRYLMEDLTPQLELLREVVGVCCLVTSDTATAPNRSMYKKCHDIFGHLAMVVRNVFAIDSEENILRAHAETRRTFEEDVQWSSDEPLEVVDVRLRRARGGMLNEEEGVTSVKATIKGFAEKNHAENIIYVNSQRERAAREIKDQAERQANTSNHMIALVDNGASRAGSLATMFAVESAANSTVEMVAQMATSVQESGMLAEVGKKVGEAGIELVNRAMQDVADSGVLSEIIEEAAVHMRNPENWKKMVEQGSGNTVTKTVASTVTSTLTSTAPQMGTTAVASVSSSFASSAFSGAMSGFN